MTKSRAITVAIVAVVIGIGTTPIVQAQPPQVAGADDARSDQQRARKSAQRPRPDRKHRRQTPQAHADLCAAAKLEAGGRYVDDTLECRAEAVAKGSNRDIAKCLGKAERRLTDTFARHEATGACTTTGEAVAFKALIDPAIGGLVASLGGPGPSRCTKQKLRAAGNDAEDKYGCQARAVSEGAGFAIDPMCWARAEEQFADGFRRGETKGDCAAGTGDAQAIDDKIDALVAQARGVVSPPVSSCTPVEVTTVHGDDFHGNSRLAKIENGLVPCLHGEEGTVAACRFSVASGTASGDWLESPEGNFAKVGQAISLNGARGGDYMVAARLSEGASASCVEPTSRDTAGRVAAGQELVERCTMEEMLMPWNAFRSSDWSPTTIVNYTTREVCSSDNPAVRAHPDNAQFVRTIIGNDGIAAYCYTGYGAALNDINGTERDEAGSYLLGEQYCHRIVNGGYETPGAKRPATKSLPAPGIVNTRTPTVWRPVNPNVNIANDLAPLPAPQTFDDKAAFLAATHSESASGELPDLGMVAGTATVGSVTFAIPPGDNSLAIGAAGTPAAPSWYPDLPGNWIALAYKGLQVTFAAPVYAMGFDFVEPATTMPPLGSTPVDSTYEVTLLNNGRLVGRFRFNAPDDVLAFVGVRSDNPFDRAWIVDVTTDASGRPSPYIGDDEFFGEFYTGRQ
jgi:hypothetical protein